MLSIKELASLAGTSIASVSRVINKKPGVNPQVRAKVEELIAEHDYRPNLLARELIQKKTRLIGILLPTIHSYYADRIAGITDVFRQHKYGTMIASARENEEEEIENFFLFYEKQVEGIIFFATVVTQRHIEVMQLISKKMPIVCVGQEIPGLPVSSVVSDNYKAGRTAILHFIENGHKTIGFIGGPHFNFSARQRFQAFQDVLTEQRIPINAEWIKEGDFTLPSGYKITKDLIDTQKNLPSALFYANDMMALGGLRALHESGVRVPEDLSIIGFDDIPLSAYSTPALTTIHQNHYDVGKQAGELLIDHFQQPNSVSKRILLEQKLVVRESVRNLR